MDIARVGRSPFSGEDPAACMTSERQSGHVRSRKIVSTAYGGHEAEPATTVTGSQEAGAAAPAKADPDVARVHEAGACKNGSRIPEKRERDACNTGLGVVRGHRVEASNSDSRIVQFSRLRRLQHSVPILHEPTRAGPATTVLRMQKTATATPATSGHDVALAHEGGACNTRSWIVQERDCAACNIGSRRYTDPRGHGLQHQFPGSRPRLRRLQHWVMTLHGPTRASPFNTVSRIAEDCNCGACNIRFRCCTSPRGRGLQQRFLDCRGPRPRRLQHRVTTLHEATRARLPAAVLGLYTFVTSAPATSGSGVVRSH